MKKEEKKPFIQCCILGAIGGILMAAGDWLLGCIPLQETDTGLHPKLIWERSMTLGRGNDRCDFCMKIMK